MLKGFRKGIACWRLLGALLKLLRGVAEKGRRIDTFGIRYNFCKYKWIVFYKNKFLLITKPRYINKYCLTSSS